MSAGARWTVVSDPRSASHAARWDDLNARSFRSPVLHSDFVWPLMTHFGDGHERLAFADDASGRATRAIVATRASPFVQDSFQPSQAPIGLWLQEDGDRGLPDASVMSALASALGSTIAMVGISQLDPEHVARPADDAAASHVTTLDYIDTARITIAGTFDAYWAARGKNLRSNMKKQRNKLDAEGVALRFDCLTDPADVAAAIVDYGRLESAGWKAPGGTAVSADNAQGRFYRDVFERFCARGMGRIYRCFYGDQLAAMDLCIEQDGVMVILKTAFDESIRGTSPAFLMRHDYLPGIFASQRLTRVEFYGRVMEWHTKWSDEVRTLYHATTYRWPVVARLDAMRRARAARRASTPAEVNGDATAAAASSGTPTDAPVSGANEKADAT